ncbi:MAG: DUF433 domain-containing protein [Kamptonema sp. SIO4C4]|nr:DUF433 domain-containing protein [Kamptonema sp. SIO4C4]
MTKAPSPDVAILRTERGLTIQGTRLTLYDVMDFLNQHYPPQLIRDKFNLTDPQIHAALSYIEANKTQVEAEYQEVLKTREEIRQYWEERNRQYFTELARKPHNPDQNALWKKLEQQKTERLAQAL